MYSGKISGIVNHPYNILKIFFIYLTIKNFIVQQVIQAFHKCKNYSFIFNPFIVPEIFKILKIILLSPSLEINPKPAKTFGKEI